MKKKLVVLTGAGISAESGISTFRDENGLWHNHKVEEVASAEAWKKDKALVLDFYNQRRRDLKDKKPNYAHLRLAELENRYDLNIITQNIDNLHERAGSTRVLHLHGELTKVRPEYGQYEEDFSEAEVFDIAYEDVNIGDLAANGSQLRPHIVWFSEDVPKISKAIDLVEEADIILIIGTSMQVYPAAALYRYAAYSTKIMLLDPASMPSLDHRIMHIRKKATEGIDEIISLIDSY